MTIHCEHAREHVAQLGAPPSWGRIEWCRRCGALRMEQDERSIRTAADASDSAPRWVWAPWELPASPHRPMDDEEREEWNAIVRRWNNVDALQTALRAFLEL
jgi:hypothetical protein